MDEAKRIHEMVDAGKISPSDGQRLLSAIRPRWGKWRDLRNGAWFPPFMLWFSLSLFVVTYGWVLPFVKEWYWEMRLDLPMLTQLSLGISQWVFTQPVAGVFGVLGVAGFFQLWITRGSVFARMAAEFLSVGVFALVFVGLTALWLPMLTLFEKFAR